MNNPSAYNSFNKTTKSSIMQRLLSNSPIPSPFSDTSLYSSLQHQINQYENLPGFNLRKTYSNFLEIGNVPSFSPQKTFIPAESMKTTHLSMLLNSTKSIKKSTLSVKNYEKSLEGDGEKAETTLKRNFSLARIILGDISKFYRLWACDAPDRLRLQCEDMKEKISQILDYLENNKLPSFSEFKTKKSAVCEINKEKYDNISKEKKEIFRLGRNFQEEISESFGGKKKEYHEIFPQCEKYETILENDEEIIKSHELNLQMKGKKKKSIFFSKEQRIKFDYHKSPKMFHSSTTNFDTKTNIEKSLELQNISLTPNIYQTKKANTVVSPLKNIFNEQKIIPETPKTVHTQINEPIARSSFKSPQRLAQLCFQNIKVSYDKLLLELVKLVHSLNLRELYLRTMLLHAKICLESKEIFKCIAILKQVKSISNDLGLFPVKLKCYERLGKAFQILKKHTLALRYFLKMLELSFVIKSKSKELLAYDLIGIQFYYQGDLKLANFFHQKLLGGVGEEFHSDLRDIACLKYNNYQKKVLNNYSLPSYIAMRSENFGMSDYLMEPSSDEESGIKLEGLLRKYRKNDIKIEKQNNTGINFRKNMAFLKQILPQKNKVSEKANANIRQKKTGLSVDLNSFSIMNGSLSNKILELSNKDGGLFAKILKISKNNCKGHTLQKNDLLRLNHLSPNRYWTKPNIYELRMNKLSKENETMLNKRITGINDRLLEKTYFKFQGSLEKYKTNLRVSLMQLNFYLTKLQKHSNNRKNALLYSPIFRKKSDLKSNNFRNISKTSVSIRKREDKKEI